VCLLSLRTSSLCPLSLENAKLILLEFTFAALRKSTSFPLSPSYPILLLLELPLSPLPVSTQSLPTIKATRSLSLNRLKLFGVNRREMQSEKRVD